MRRRESSSGFASIARYKASRSVTTYSSGQHGQETRERCHQSRKSILSHPSSFIPFQVLLLIGIFRSVAVVNFQCQKTQSRGSQTAAVLTYVSCLRRPTPTIGLSPVLKRDEPVLHPSFASAIGSFRPIVPGRPLLLAVKPNHLSGIVVEIHVEIGFRLRR